MKSSNLIKLRDAGFNVPKFFVISELSEIFGLKDLRNDVLYAVRSSCSDEDSNNTANAGKYLTRLNVPKHEIYSTIKDVFDSYKGKDGTVIVQEMIDSDYSGVMFSINPLGILNEYVVTVCKGIGVGVVDNESETTSYFYNIDDDDIYKSNDYVSLDNSVLKSLLKLVFRIKRAFGYDVDIEFAIKDSVVYIRIV